MSETTYLNPVGSGETIIAQGHDLAPGESFAVDLAGLRPDTIKAVDDGKLTATPTLSAEILEAGRGLLHDDTRWTNPVTSQFDKYGRTSQLLKHMVSQAILNTQIVFESDNGPKAFATGVEVTIEVRDAAGNPDFSNSGLKVKINLVAFGTLPAGAPSFTVNSINVDPDDATKVIFRSGRARITVKGTSAGDVRVGLQEPSRSLTVTDLTDLSLT